MTSFLEDMAYSSRLRVAQAREREPDEMIEERARRSPSPPTLRLHPEFDVVAELKFRSPASGVLAAADHDWSKRIEGYAEAGAVAVSVLTEPSRFEGSLAHLSAAADLLRPFRRPAMRKDFIVERYQIWEARAAGAGGVLIIVKMLSRNQIEDLLDCALQCGLFVLLEAFDMQDLDLAADILRGSHWAQDAVMLGVNSRDLRSLAVDASSFERFAERLPNDRPCVAESGVDSPDEARRLRELGFRAALVGSALMSSAAPHELLAKMLAAARTL